jgi:hypothetical protein
VCVCVVAMVREPYRQKEFERQKKKVKEKEK